VITAPVIMGITLLWILLLNRDTVGIEEILTMEVKI
jgi:hypothetical protein